MYCSLFGHSVVVHEITCQNRRSDMTLGALRKELRETGIKDLIEKGQKK